MKRRLKQLHLKNKLILLAGASAALALVLASTVFIVNDFQLLRDSKLSRLQTEARMLATHAAPIVANPDRMNAEQLGHFLRQQKSVEIVALYDKHGKLLADHLNVRGEKSPENLQQRDGHRFTPQGALEYFQPIYAGKLRIGTVYLRDDMHDMWGQMYGRTRASFLASIFVFCVAILFASTMQRVISGPIVNLAQTARLITTSHDYSIRASTDLEDELGDLYQSFNSMIEQIQSTRSELEEAKNLLESRVLDRTRRLQNEIERREQIEAELLKAKEKAESASLAKSRFLANMSHEIRTPLNAILGFTDLLRRGVDRGDEAERRDYLETIHHSGEHLLTLINDILDLSKIEAGQMDYEHIRFSPHQVIAEVISVMRARAFQKGLALDYHWYGHLPETIEGDPNRYRQLLLNLVGNAIKFTERGGVQVVAKMDPQTSELMVDVIDTGIGINPESMNNLFTAFAQADNSVTRRFGGTGLGLSISKHIATNLGGDICVQSEPGRGSTFTVTVGTGNLKGVRLLQKPVADFPPQDAEIRPAATGHLRGTSILVVDDGDTNRKLIRLVLSRAGAEVITAENGLEAVKAAQTQKFDIVLMDMQMPVMDGYTATRTLRSNGFNRPIVALTAHAMRGDSEQCFDAGCSDYLSKPINPEKLLEKIALILAGTGSSASIPIIDLDELDTSNERLVSELPTDDPEFAEIVCEFIERASEKLAEMHTAFEEGDMPELAQLSHWLKGAGGTSGFPILTEKARELEHAINRGNRGEIEVSLSELGDMIGRMLVPETSACPTG